MTQNTASLLSGVASSETSSRTLSSALTDISMQFFQKCTLSPQLAIQAILEGKDAVFDHAYESRPRGVTVSPQTSRCHDTGDH